MEGASPKEIMIVYQRFAGALCKIFFRLCWLPDVCNCQSLLALPISPSLDIKEAWILCFLKWIWGLGLPSFWLAPSWSINLFLLQTLMFWILAFWSDWPMDFGLVIGSYSIFNFLRHFHTVSHSGYTNVHFHHQGVPFLHIFTSIWYLLSFVKDGTHPKFILYIGCVGTLQGALFSYECDFSVLRLPFQSTIVEVA